MPTRNGTSSTQSLRSDISGVPPLNTDKIAGIPPVGRGDKSLVPIADFFQKYPRLNDVIGKYEPYYNQYRFQMEGIPYKIDGGMDKIKKDLKEQLDNYKPKVDFKLGPFAQKESDGVLESRVRFIELVKLPNGQTAKIAFELVGKQRWTGPLEAGDPPKALQGRPEYFLRRVNKA